MNEYTIIEDIFGDEDKNQVTAARGFVGRSHVPDDLRPKGKVGRVTNRPDIPDLSGFDTQPSPPSMGYNQPPMMGGQFGSFPDIQLAMGAVQQQGPTLYPGVDSLQCRDVFTHVENCPICSSYFKRDTKFYWLIIGILVIVILLLTRNGK